MLVLEKFFTNFQKSHVKFHRAEGIDLVFLLNVAPTKDVFIEYLKFVATGQILALRVH